MSVVKPSSLRVPVQPVSPRAWDMGSDLQAENPRAWEAATSGDPISLGSARKSADNKPVRHRMAIDCSVVHSHTEPDPYPLPLLKRAGPVLANYQCYVSLDIYKGFWQIPLHKDSHDCFTFITPKGIGECHKGAAMPPPVL